MTSRWFRVSLVVGALAAAVLPIAACSSSEPGGTGATAPGAASATSSSSSSSVASGSATPSGLTDVVRVIVADVHGATGGSLAGMVMPGTEAQFGKDTVMGGFATGVPSDPYTTTQTVTTGQPDPGSGQYAGLFPWVTRTPVRFAPGTYVMTLWADSRTLGPYGRWVPGLTDTLRGCHLVFTVVEGRATTLRVDGIPAWSGGDQVCRVA